MFSLRSIHYRSPDNISLAQLSGSIWVCVGAIREVTIVPPLAHPLSPPPLDAYTRVMSLNEDYFSWPDNNSRSKSHTWTQCHRWRHRPSIYMVKSILVSGPCLVRGLSHWFPWRQVPLSQCQRDPGWQQGAASWQRMCYCFVVARVEVS